MDSVREWAFSLCCVSVIGTILSMITPSGKEKKNAGLIISMMVLLTVCRPLIALRELVPELKKYSFDISRSENRNLEEEVFNGAGKVYASYLRENLERVLDGSGIKYKSIDVMMDKSENGCISIGQVEVIVENEDVNQSEKIKSLLRAYIGFEPTVITAVQKGSDSYEETEGYD